jgi:hypothetical protein
MIVYVAFAVVLALQIVLNTSQCDFITQTASWTSNSTLRAQSIDALAYAASRTSLAAVEVA